MLLISVDTLRADHLGCYGYPRATSPHLDALAAEAVRFETAIAPAPWTLPSHAALLTGTHPWLLGIRDGQAAVPEVPTLAGELARAGYQTAAFVDSSARGYVGAERGFARGFAEYHHQPHRPGRRHDAAATVDAALDWLASRDRDRPYFLFLHTKSVHALPIGAPCTDEHCFPYDKPEPYRSFFFDPASAERVWSVDGQGHGQAYLWSLNRALQAGARREAAASAEDLAALRALYDAGIAATDAELGRLLAGLAAAGELENTVVVVTADHGEAFLDHDLLLHQEVYDELLHVPLLVRLPRGEARVVREPVALEDVMPTVLRLAGAPLPAGLTGLPLLGGAAPPPGRAFFAYYTFYPPYDYGAVALRQGHWKLVAQNFQRPRGDEAWQLFDLAGDPGETRPLRPEGPEAERLRHLLEAWRARPPLPGSRHLPSLPGNAALEALGYVDG